MNISISNVIRNALSLAASAWLETLVLTVVTAPVIWFVMDYSARGGDQTILNVGLWIPQMLGAAFAAIIFFNAFDNKASDEEQELPFAELAKLTGVLFLANFFVSIGTTIGTFLCFIPGIIVGVGLFLTPIVAFKERCSPVDALSRSWSMTYGRKLDIFLVLLALTVIAMLAFVPLFGAGMMLAYGSSASAEVAGIATSLSISMSIITALSTAVTLNVLLATEYTLYEEFHVPIRRASDIRREPAAAPPPTTPKAPSEPPRGPITVDADIVFGGGDNDDDGENGMDGW